MNGVRKVKGRGLEGRQVVHVVGPVLVRFAGGKVQVARHLRTSKFSGWAIEDERGCLHALFDTFGFCKPESSPAETLCFVNSAHTQCTAPRPPSFMAHLVDAELSPDAAALALCRADLLEVLVMLALLHRLRLLHGPAAHTVRLPHLLARVAALAGLALGAVAGPARRRAVVHQGRGHGPVLGAHLVQDVAADRVALRVQPPPVYRVVLQERGDREVGDKGLPCHTISSIHHHKCIISIRPVFGNHTHHVQVQLAADVHGVHREPGAGDVVQRDIKLEGKEGQK